MEKVVGTLAFTSSYVWRIIFVWACFWALIVVLLRALAPDPVTVLSGVFIDEATRRFLSEEFGLQRGLLQEYVTTLLKMSTFDFGKSRLSGLPVSQTIARPLTLSLVLTTIGTVGAVVAAVTAWLTTMAAGIGSGGRLLSAMVTGTSAVPGFILALLLSRSDLLPMLGLPVHGLGSNLISGLLAPALCVATPVLAYGILRGMALSAEMLASPWFRVARAFGGRRETIAIKLGWPLMMSAVLDIFMHAALLSLTGSVAVEYVFGLPALGTAMIDAIQLHDEPVILGIVSIVVTATIVLYFLRGLIRDILLYP